MKKLLAILLAVAMMVSLSAVAFAAEIGDIPEDEDDEGVQAAIDFGAIYTGEDEDMDEVVDPDAVEDPGTVYYIELVDAVTDDPITIADAGFYKFSYKITKGSSSVASVKVVSAATADGEDNQAFIEVKTVSNFSVDEVDIAIELVLTPKKTPLSEGLEKLDGQFTATIGWSVLVDAVDDDITFVDEGKGILAFYEEFPESDIELNFGDVAYFLSSVRKPKDVVISFSIEADEDIEEEYEDADLLFIDLRSGAFRQTGALYVPADEDSFLYELVNGKLVKSKAVYDEDEEAFVLKGLKQLGFYVLSDIELEVAGSTVENPETGANNVIGIAAALAVVSLVAAGAVSFKK